MKGNVCHLKPVQVVSILIQDGRPVVHHAVPGHHPRACGKKNTPVHASSASRGSHGGVSASPERRLVIVEGNCR